MLYPIKADIQKTLTNCILEPILILFDKLSVTLFVHNIFLLGCQVEPVET